MCTQYDLHKCQKQAKLIYANKIQGKVSTGKKK